MRSDTNDFPDSPRLPALQKKTVFHRSNMSKFIDKSFRYTEPEKSTELDRSRTIRTLNQSMDLPKVVTNLPADIMSPKNNRNKEKVVVASHIGIRKKNDKDLRIKQLLNDCSDQF